MSKAPILFLLLFRASQWGASTTHESRISLPKVLLQDEGPVEQGYLNEYDLVQLTRPLRRHKLEHPDDYLVYNRTADKWQQGVLQPLAIRGRGSCNVKVKMALKRFGRPDDELEDIIHRYGCEPPFCESCPLQGKIALTTKTLLLYKDLTGRRINVTTAIRSGINEEAFPGLSFLAYHCDEARGRQQELDYLLFRYVEAGETKFVSRLIELGANIRSRDEYKMTLLHVVASEGHTDIVDLLLDLKLDCHSLDEYNRTPMHWAALYGHLAVIIAMFKHPNGIKAPDQVSMIHREDDDGDSPFSLALISGRPACYLFFSRVKTHGFQKAEEMAQEDLEYLKTSPKEKELVKKFYQVIQQENMKDEIQRADVIVEGDLIKFPHFNPNKTQRCVVGFGNETIVNELPWGPGTDFPTPWSCWFCNSQFGRCADAMEHELECCKDYGFVYDPKVGWRKNESDQIVRLENRRRLDSRILSNDKGAMDIEDVAESLYQRFAKKEKSTVEKQKIPPPFSKVLRDFHRRAQSEPQLLADEMKRMFLCSATNIRPFDFNQADVPIGIATDARYEQLPPYLRDKEEYAKFMRGESVIAPPKDVQADPGKRLLSDLTEQEKAALGIKTNEPASQTSSLLRKNKIKAMSKDDIINTLEQYGIRDLPMKQPAALRQLLVEVETDLGLILPPADWNEKKRRRLQIDERFLKKKQAFGEPTTEVAPAPETKQVKKEEVAEDEMLASEAAQSQAEAEESLHLSQVSAKSSSGGGEGSEGSDPEDGSFGGEGDEDVG